MENYQVVINGFKKDMNIDHVLNDLAILFKSDPEQLRSLLMSGNLVAKSSLNLEAAHKYQKVLEDIGCIVTIESDLVFDLPELVHQDDSSEKRSSFIDKTTNIQVEDETHVSYSSVIPKPKSSSQNGLSPSDDYLNLNTKTTDYSELGKNKLNQNRKGILIGISVLIVISAVTAGGVIFFKKSKPILTSENNKPVKENNASTSPIASSGVPPITPVVQPPTSSNAQSIKVPAISDDKLGEIVSRENSNYLGDYYVVKLQPSGFSPINVDIKANTPEEALAKIVKKDDFLLVRSESNREKIYVARYGKIINLPIDFIVPESSSTGVSYQNNRLGPEEESVKFEGYSGLNGETVVITAKRFFVLTDNNLNIDTDYIWNFKSNRELYTNSLKTFDDAITELGSSSKEFDPNNPQLWNQIMIPAAKALLIATISKRDAEVSSIYSRLEEKYGKDTVDFLKNKLELVRINSIPIDELAKAQQSQEKINTNKSINASPVESNQSSVIGIWKCESEDKRYTFDTGGRVLLDSWSTGPHNYLHGTYLQGNDNVRITYNSIETNSINVPLKTSLKGTIAQALSSDKISVIDPDSTTGKNYPPYECIRAIAPISSQRSSVTTIDQQGDVVEKYADSLATQLENSSIPACQAFASSIRSLGGSGAPDYIRQRQVDTIFDKVPSMCLQ